MGANSKIQWCDHTFNPWIGCTKVAPGCAHCYAWLDMAIRRKRVIWGPHGTRSRTSVDYWRQPYRWNRAAECLGTFDCANGDHADCCPQKVRPRVFCASLADVFEEPLANSGFAADVAQWRNELFSVIDDTPNVDWLLLTKRPENIRKMWPEPPRPPTPQHWWRDYRWNVWLITSVSEQASADRNIPYVLDCWDLAPVLGVSYEPALGPVDFLKLYSSCGYHCAEEVGHVDHKQIDWLILGGESGPKARPCKYEWLRDALLDAASLSCPAFVKQLGANFWVGSSEDSRQKLRDPKGGDWSEWETDLQIRRFPDSQILRRSCAKL